MSIILGLGALVAITAMLRTWLRGQRQLSDLGFVSQQWLAEHRFSQAQNPQR
jgi:hypothetical protein